MSADPLRSVYLLSGSDRPKVARALRRLRARFPAESVEVLAADAVSGADAVAACNALGLFGSDGGRLVVVEGVETWSAGDAEAVSEYLAGGAAPGAVLALVATAAPRTDALANLAAKYGRVLAYEVPRPRNPLSWVVAEFERLGVAVDAEAARALVEIVGDDVLLLAAEIDKIAAWARGGDVGVDDMAALAVPAREAEAWALTDSWGARDLPAALRACELALEQKEPFVLALALATHVGRVRVAQSLAAEGLGTRDIAKRLRVKEFPARKAVAHAQNYTSEELDAALVRLADLDARLKGASRLSAELELQRALIDVTRERRPSPAAPVPA